MMPTDQENPGREFSLFAEELWRPRQQSRWWKRRDGA